MPRPETRRLRGIRLDGLTARLDKAHVWLADVWDAVAPKVARSPSGRPCCARSTDRLDRAGHQRFGLAGRVGAGLSRARYLAAFGLLLVVLSGLLTSGG